MIESKDILAMLESGVSLDSIADEFTKKLNEAKSEYEKKKAELEEMRLKKEQEVQKKIDLESIMDDFIDWAQIYDECPLTVKYLKTMTAEEMLEAIPMIEEAVKVRENMETLLASLNKVPVVKTTAKPAAKAIDKTADDILKTFVQTMGW